jgi:hypothetical protein
MAGDTRKVMNIFILNTGRCGSSTFIKACQHITNYTAAHESRATLIGEDRLAYADHHIEADNRLSWMLGRLDRQFSDRAVYVRLSRDIKQTADSFKRRADYGIMKSYREGILMGAQAGQSDYDLAMDYIDTVESNIKLFLRDKTNTMDFQLDRAKPDFVEFWKMIGAEGDLDSALAEWDINYNAS